jgi:hypothetical protein
VALNWIKSYLSNRKQKVKLNFDEEGSEWKSIKHGIPQGTLLAPILFSLYVNDLAAAATSVNTEVILYADDTSLIVHGENDAELLANFQNTLKTAESWFKPNQLKLNHDKTNIVIFKGKGSVGITEVTCGNHTLDTKESCNFLGMTVDRRLKWNEHAKKLSTTLSSACYVLSNLVRQVNETTAKIAFHALIQSKIRYGILLWGGSPIATRVFRKQKRALRILCHLRNRQSCKPFFIKHQVLTLTCIYILELLLYVVDSTGVFTKNTDVHNFNTRQNNFRQTRVRLNITKWNPENIGANIFNNLPDNLQAQSGKREAFKEMTKTFLFNHGFYTLDEFRLAKYCKCKICEMKCT